MADPALTDWCTRHGVVFNGIQAAFVPEGWRGIVATKDLQPGEVILRVPERLLLTTRSAARDPLLSAALLRHPGLTPHQRLAAHLLHEVSKGPDSFWWPYLRQIPRSYTSLPNFSPDDIAALQLQSAREVAEAAVEQARADWQAALPLLRSLGLPKRFLVLRSWLWAASTLHSRTMYLPWCEAGALTPYGDLHNYEPPPAPYVPGLAETVASEDASASACTPSNDRGIGGCGGDAGGCGCAAGGGAPPVGCGEAADRTAAASVLQPQIDPGSDAGDLRGDEAGAYNSTAVTEQPEQRRGSAGDGDAPVGAVVTHGSGVAVSQGSGHTSSPHPPQQAADCAQRPADTAVGAGGDDPPGCSEKAGGGVEGSGPQVDSLQGGSAAGGSVCGGAGGEAGLQAAVAGFVGAGAAGTRQGADPAALSSSLPSAAAAIAAAAAAAAEGSSSPSPAAAVAAAGVSDSSAWDGMWDEGSQQYCIMVHRPYRRGEQVMLRYGCYTNLQLLEHYGFVMQDNPHDTALLDPSLLPGPPPPDDRRPWATPWLAPDQAFLRANGQPGWDLLGYLRACAASPEERRSHAQALAAGERVSEQGDRQVLRWLHSAASRQLAALGTSLDQDRPLAAALEQHQRPPSQEQQQQGQEQGQQEQQEQGPQQQPHSLEPESSEGGGETGVGTERHAAERPAAAAAVAGKGPPSSCVSNGASHGQQREPCGAEDADAAAAGAAPPRPPAPTSRSEAPPAGPGPTAALSDGFTCVGVALQWRILHKQILTRTIKMAEAVLGPQLGQDQDQGRFRQRGRVAGRAADAGPAPRDLGELLALQRQRLRGVASG